jgi:hypothetical protein
VIEFTGEPVPKLECSACGVRSPVTAKKCEGCKVKFDPAFLRTLDYERTHREALKFACKQVGRFNKEIFEDYIFQGKLAPAQALELYNELGARIGYEMVDELVPNEIPLFYKNWIPRNRKK